MAFSRFAPGCCCLSGCTIYGDEFTTDTLGSNWSDIAGTWSIATGVLSTDDAAALLIADQLHPDGDDSPHIVRVQVRWDTAGDRARIIAAYTDPDNYLFVECWIDADGCGHVRAYERSGGTDLAAGPEVTVPFDLPLNAWHTVTVCYTAGTYPDPGRLGVRVLSAAGNRWHDAYDVTPALPGDQAGLATGTPVDGTIDFDNFSFQFHFDAETHPDCPQCEDAEGTCTLHTDEFTHADGTAVGCGWEEVAEDWEIDTNELTVSAADAILRNRTRHPDDDAHVQIVVSFRAAAGGVVLILLDYEDDANFLFVQLEPGSHGDCGQVSFWRRTAGVDAQLGTSSIIPGMVEAATHTATVCWKGDLLKVNVAVAVGTDYNGGSHSVYGVTQVAVEPYVGLGSGSANQVWFDSFTLRRSQDAEHLTCPDCETGNCALYCGDPRDETITDLNCLWNEVAGTWAIEACPDTTFPTHCGSFEALKIDEDDAMLVNETGHPGTTAEGFLDLTSGASVQVSNTSYGNIIQLLIGWQDANNYLFAEFEYAAAAGDTGTLRVGKVVAGTRTVIASQASSIGGSMPQIPGFDPDSVDVPSEFRVCYDGYEIRAMFVVNPVAAAFTQSTYVRGDAGTGWNPGKSGLATTTSTGPVYFGNFIYYHDIFGGGGDFCLACPFAAECPFCGVNDEGGVIDCYDRTPPIVLVEITGLQGYMMQQVPIQGGGCSGEDSGCPELEERINDTFALPFLEGNGGTGATCEWKMHPDFCLAYAPTYFGGYMRPSIRFIAKRSASAGPSRFWEYDVRVSLYSEGPGLSFTGCELRYRYLDQTHQPAAGTGNNYNQDCTNTTPSVGAEMGFNCNEKWADWRNVPAVDDPLDTFCRFKVLAA